MAINISAWSIRHPLPPLVVAAAIVALGYISFTKLLDHVGREVDAGQAQGVQAPPVILGLDVGRAHQLERPRGAAPFRHLGPLQVNGAREHGRGVQSGHVRRGRTHGASVSSIHIPRDQPSMATTSSAQPMP